MSAGASSAVTFRTGDTLGFQLGIRGAKPASRRIRPDDVGDDCFGDAYTFAHYERMFAHAGFARSTFHPLSPTPQQAIVSFKS